ncbi:hypothetical protein FO519_009766 [Halicephalobus sp. NKZ332]|nr:hypothetical protein FO519_009766 [Halicephalobus sp. NKZ332]
MENLGNDLANILHSALNATSAKWFNQYIFITYDYDKLLNGGNATTVDEFVDLYYNFTSNIDSGGCSNYHCLPFDVLAKYNIPPNSVMYDIISGGGDIGFTSPFAFIDIILHYIVVIPKDVNITVIGPDGNVINDTSLYFNDKNVVAYGSSIYRVPFVGPGIYGFSSSKPVNTNSSAVQIIVKGSQVYGSFIPVTSSDPEYGIDMDNTVDTLTTQETRLVLHADDNNMKLQYAKIISSKLDVEYVQLHGRHGCSYEWYSDVFQCANIGEMHIIIVFGVDDTETFFTREFMVACYDISQAISFGQFNDTVDFVLNALNQFNFDYLEGIAVGLISVYGDDIQYQLPVRNFNMTPEYKSLKYYLQSARPADTFISGIGQKALNLALNITISPQFKASGYKSDIQNHLIVYITTTSIPDQAAIDKASDILTSGDYKIIAISYQGNGSNLDALQKLVGGNSGCVLTSSTREDYMGDFAGSFTERIIDASNNGGNYC